VHEENERERNKKLNFSIEDRTAMVKVLILAFLVATLLATLLSAAPAGADVVPAGNARSWGDNYFGQLGNGSSGTATSRNIPGAIKNLSGVKSIKAGCAHGLGLKTDGTVRAWGDNSYGQLGDATLGIDSNVPVETYNLDNVKAISAGCNHNLALKENGTVWAWGDNEYGQLGNGFSGPGQYYNAPVKVASLGTGVKAVAAGRDFSLALVKDGTVRSWGRNTDGQLGNGDPLPGANKTTPVKVANLSGVKAIATDGFARHALALKQDGTVRSWGDDDSGQLGNGDPLPGTDKAAPVRVKNLSGVKAVAAGGYHSLALLSSGKVRSWGANLDGQLGNDRSGIGTEKNTPVSVSQLTNVRTISGGAYHSLAVLEGGSARSWGDNEYGQLGNDNFGTDSDVPVVVRDLLDVKSIDGGYEFTLATTG
jgi:alpha-tubulin suppressor-like RCC1 family protein